MHLALSLLLKMLLISIQLYTKNVSGSPLTRPLLLLLLIAYVFCVVKLCSVEKEVVKDRWLLITLRVVEKGLNECNCFVRIGTF